MTIASEILRLQRLAEYYHEVGCLKVAEEYRQRAQWLAEYKKLLRYSRQGRKDNG